MYMLVGVLVEVVGVVSNVEKESHTFTLGVRVQKSMAIHQQPR